MNLNRKLDPLFFWLDEESSGVIDVTDILGSAGQNAYLLGVQAYYPNGPELVEGGQLLLMHMDPVLCAGRTTLADSHSSDNGPAPRAGPSPRVGAARTGSCQK